MMHGTMKLKINTALCRANGKVGIGFECVSVSEYFDVFMLEITIAIWVRLGI